ncbi:hypothetical protein BZA70DRAFT_311477 [Myxozyma melibiosi]|uniref:RRM domain-containing protein n=1 Tax=Myxozyma melibiosi TaxID=54550 RepID=A0ABR1F3E2_9ASCO
MADEVLQASSAGALNAAKATPPGQLPAKPLIPPPSGDPSKTRDAPRYPSAELRGSWGNRQYSTAPGIQTHDTADPRPMREDLRHVSDRPGQYPDRPKADYEEIKSTIYVGNLPSNIVDEQLFEAFSVYGKIESLHRRKQPANPQYHDTSPSQYAFIRFLNPISATIAINERDGTFIGSNRIAVRKRHPGTDMSPSEPDLDGVPKMQMGRMNTGQGDNRQKFGHKSHPHRNQKMHDQLHMVSIANIPFDMSPEALCHFVLGTAPVATSDIVAADIYDYPDENGRRHGDLTLNSYQAAITVIETVNNRVVNDYILTATLNRQFPQYMNNQAPFGFWPQDPNSVPPPMPYPPMFEEFPPQFMHMPNPNRQYFPPYLYWHPSTGTYLPYAMPPEYQYPYDGMKMPMQRGYQPAPNGSETSTQRSCSIATDMSTAADEEPTVDLAPQIIVEPAVDPPLEEEVLTVAPPPDESMQTEIQAIVSHERSRTLDMDLERRSLESEDIEQSNSPFVRQRAKTFVGDPSLLRPHWPIDHCNLFVRNVDLAVLPTCHELRRLFESYGPIESTRMVPVNAWTAKGYGFVLFLNKEDAQKAQSKMDGHMVGQYAIRVTYAEKRESRTVRMGKGRRKGPIPRFGKGRKLSASGDVNTANLVPPTSITEVAQSMKQETATTQKSGVDQDLKVKQTVEIKTTVSLADGATAGQSPKPVVQPSVAIAIEEKLKVAEGTEVLGEGELDTTTPAVAEVTEKVQKSFFEESEVCLQAETTEESCATVVTEEVLANTDSTKEETDCTADLVAKTSGLVEKTFSEAKKEVTLTEAMIEDVNQKLEGFPLTMPEKPNGEQSSEPVASSELAGCADGTISSETGQEETTELAKSEDKQIASKDASDQDSDQAGFLETAVTGESTAVPEMVAPDSQLHSEDTGLIKSEEIECTGKTGEVEAMQPSEAVLDAQPQCTGITDAVDLGDSNTESPEEAEGHDSAASEQSAVSKEANSDVGLLGAIVSEPAGLGSSTTAQITNNAEELGLTASGNKVANAQPGDAFMSEDSGVSSADQNVEQAEEPKFEEPDDEAQRHCATTSETADSRVSPQNTDNVGGSESAEPQMSPVANEIISDLQFPSETATDAAELGVSDSDRTNEECLCANATETVSEKESDGEGQQTDEEPALVNRVEASTEAEQNLCVSETTKEKIEGDLSSKEIEDDTLESDCDFKGDREGLFITVQSSMGASRVGIASNAASGLERCFNQSRKENSKSPSSYASYSSTTSSVSVSVPAYAHENFAVPQSGAGLLQVQSPNMVNSSKDKDVDTVDMKTARDLGNACSPTESVEVIPLKRDSNDNRFTRGCARTKSMDSITSSLGSNDSFCDCGDESCTYAPKAKLEKQALRSASLSNMVLFTL